mgnify:CR=1 FL=1
MNFISDELFEIYLKNKFLSDSEKEKIIEDLYYLEKKVKPYGLLKAIDKEKIYTLDSTNLLMIHSWQSQLFAIKFFGENSKNIQSNYIFGFSL